MLSVPMTTETASYHQQILRASVLQEKGYNQMTIQRRKKNQNERNAFSYL